MRGYTPVRPLIGLTGGIYEYTYTGTGGGTVRSGSANLLNAVGQVAGYTDRYSASGSELGQAGWFYDDNTNTTTALEFSVRSSDNDSYTMPQFLTDAGVVLGTYELFTQTNAPSLRAFWWSEGAGFRDLGSLVDGGLSNEGWQYLMESVSAYTPVNTPGESPYYIVGSGLIIGQSYGQSAYLLTAIPEPASLAVFAIGGIALLRRRYSERSAFGS